MVNIYPEKAQIYISFSSKKFSDTSILLAFGSPLWIWFEPWYIIGQWTWKKSP